MTPRTPTRSQPTAPVGRPPRSPDGVTREMAKKTTKKTLDSAAVRGVLEAGEGIVRLAPTWVPRSFLMPGRRLKLHPDDVYALGAHRGGIDERWFASTTPAANENASPDE